MSYRQSWMINRSVGSVFLVTLVAAIQGCASTDANKSESLSKPLDLSRPTHMVSSLAGRSVEGRPIEILSFGTGSECVLILASIHGDEAAGTPLLETLAYELMRHRKWIRDDQRVVIVPHVNPDGVAANTRTNVNDVDLNRNFPSSNYRESRSHGTGPLSEPESQALFKLIEDLRPVRVVSIHQPLNCIDYDGPAKALAIAMAEACDLPVRKLGARPGSLGSYVGLELGIPIVTVELPPSASRWSRGHLWNQYGEMLLIAIRLK